MAVIQLIACPRTLSTALMYSFAQRDDTSVVDEPFYANYLTRTGKDHPAKEAILSAQSSDLLVPIAAMQSHAKEHMFVKNIAHHLHGLDLDYLLGFKNILYLRDPRRILTSFAKVMPNPSLLDIGIKVMYETMLKLQEADKPFLVLNSTDLLSAPEAMLKTLCSQLGIDFQASMLQWPPGPKSYDGVWASYWYKSLHNSSGFGKENISKDALPVHLESLCAEATEYYNLINKHALKID